MPGSLVESAQTVQPSTSSSSISVEDTQEAVLKAELEKFLKGNHSPSQALLVRRNSLFKKTFSKQKKMTKILWDENGTN